MSGATDSFPKAPVEFGAKLDNSVVNGFTRLEYHSFYAYNEALKLPEMIQRYFDRTGSYPERFLADKIYRNHDNLAYCTERKIRLSGPALGRPKKGELRDKKQDYIDEAERIEVETKIQLSKKQMRNWTDCDKIKGINLPLPCYVRFAAEPPKNR